MTPDPAKLAEALRLCTSQYANANRGSDEHPLGHAEVGTIQEMLPQARSYPGVAAGYAVRFKDGSTFLVNVHLIPGTVPTSPSPSEGQPPGA
jgi:hypothetical protein